MATTLIRGAGFGGLGAADELRKLLPRSHRIIVVDQSPDFYVGATKSWIMTGEKNGKQSKNKKSPHKKRTPGGKTSPPGPDRRPNPF